MSATMIEESAARLFGHNVNRALLERFEAGTWPQALWQLLSDNGLPLALAAESCGGIGASWSEAYPILRGLGYWQVPVPLAESMIGALLLSRAGIEVPDGPMTLIEEHPDNQFTVTREGTALRVTGTAVRVRWARHCRWACVALADGGGALVDLRDASAVQLTERVNPASEPWDDVTLRTAPVLARFDNPMPPLAQPLRTLGAIATSAMMVGAMEWLLEQSVQYANDRVQFGRPIGKNQAIQQALAVLAGDVAAARTAALVACADAPGWDAAACDATFFSTAVAKIRVGEAATRATSIAHQVHGAIGFTYEHALNFATRRLWAWREAYGADGWWAQKLGEAAIAARAKGFWPGITRRQF